MRGAIWWFVHQAAPAQNDGQSRHVRGGSRQRGDHRAALRERRSPDRFGFNLQITLWLWFTVLFANFAEAMAEGRGKAQAETCESRSETVANRVLPTARSKDCQLEVALGRYCDTLLPASSSPGTAKLSKASRRWTNPRLPANRRR